MGENNEEECKGGKEQSVRRGEEIEKKVKKKMENGRKKREGERRK